MTAADGTGWALLALCAIAYVWWRFSLLGWIIRLAVRSARLALPVLALGAGGAVVLRYLEAMP